MITEFMARNDGFLEDGDGNAPDWIEIQNTGDTVIDLTGYRLTDDPSNLSRWTFPSARVDPSQYLVVFASGQGVDNYVDAGGSFHTNFGLSAGGEYLALVGPDPGAIAVITESRVCLDRQAAVGIDDLDRNGTFRFDSV